jgi:hypothetical protein
VTRRVYTEPVSVTTAQAMAAATTILQILHSHDVAMTQPHAMVNDDGDVFYPDGPDDARHFVEHHGAWPLHGNT